MTQVVCMRAPNLPAQQSMQIVDQHIVRLVHVRQLQQVHDAILRHAQSVGTSERGHSALVAQAKDIDGKIVLPLDPLQLR